MQKCVGDSCRFLYLPLNVVTAKIILRELDLLSEGQIIKCEYLWNGESSCKNAQNDFKDLDICKVTPNDLGPLFQGQTF